MEAVFYVMDDTEKGTEAEEEAVTDEFWEICGPFRVDIVRVYIGQFLIRFTGEFWEICGPFRVGMDNF